MTHLRRPTHLKQCRKQSLLPQEACLVQTALSRLQRLSFLQDPAICSASEPPPHLVSNAPIFCRQNQAEVVDTPDFPAICPALEQPNPARNVPFHHRNRAEVGFSDPPAIRSASERPNLSRNAPYQQNQVEAGILDFPVICSASEPPNLVRNAPYHQQNQVEAEIMDFLAICSASGRPNPAKNVPYHCQNLAEIDISDLPAICSSLERPNSRRKAPSHHRNQAEVDICDLSAIRSALEQSNPLRKVPHHHQNQAEADISDLLAFFSASRRPNPARNVPHHHRQNRVEADISGLMAIRSALEQPTMAKNAPNHRQNQAEADISDLPAIRSASELPNRTRNALYPRQNLAEVHVSDSGSSRMPPIASRIPSVRGKNLLGRRNFSSSISDRISIIRSNKSSSADRTQESYSRTVSTTASSFSETSNYSIYVSESESTPAFLPNSSTTASNAEYLHYRQGIARDGNRGLLNTNQIRHLSFTVKYAPQTFSDIAGQNLVIQYLLKSSSRGKTAATPPLVYVFCGPRGTGKTSCARLLGKSLHCLSDPFATEKPCNSCKGCMDFNSDTLSCICEFNAVGKHVLKQIKQLLRNGNIWANSTKSHYKVVVVEECQAFSAHSWDSLHKILDMTPSNVAFVLITSHMDAVHPRILSRSQKLVFTRVADLDIVTRLKAIAAQEALHVDDEALRLIAARSHGSLRDAEVMLDQLSLLGQNIPLSLVQQLVGLIPDDQLVKLLDFSLSADTVRTVQSVKELIESGFDPLTLMSQLAALITSILAGSYMIPTDGRRRKFFRHADLSRENTECLRQALKILSEAEEQLHGSMDRTAWLTAALLQFAPDQSYLLSNSCTNTSKTLSPERQRFGIETTDEARHEQRSLGIQLSGLEGALEKMDEQSDEILEYKSSNSMASSYLAVCASSACIDKLENSSVKQSSLQSAIVMEDIWQRVLDAVHSNSLRQFLQNQGRLLSLSVLKAVSAAHLEFQEPEHVARAQRCISGISYAFQAVLGFPVDTKITLAEARGNKLIKPVVYQDNLSDKGSADSLGHPDDTRSSASTCKGICPKVADKVVPLRKGSFRRRKFVKGLSSQEQLVKHWAPERQSTLGHLIRESYKCKKDDADLATSSTRKRALGPGTADGSNKGCGADSRSKSANSFHMNQKVIKYLSVHRSNSAAIRLEKRNLSAAFRFSSWEKSSQTDPLLCVLQALSCREWKIHMFKFWLIFRIGLYRSLESNSGGLLGWKRSKISRGKTSQHVKNWSGRSRFIFRLMPCQKA